MSELHPTALRPHWLWPLSVYVHKSVEGRIQAAPGSPCSVSRERLGAAGDSRINTGSRVKKRSPRAPSVHREYECCPTFSPLQTVSRPLSPCPHLVGPSAHHLSGACGLLPAAQRPCNTGLPRLWASASAMFPLRRNKGRCPWPEGPGALASRWDRFLVPQLLP